MAERIDIITAVADHLRRRGPLPVDPIDIGQAIDQAFFTIPRSEITDCDYEYSIPQDMAEDEPVVEGFHAHVVNNALLDAYSKGLMPVEIPTPASVAAGSSALPVPGPLPPDLPRSEGGVKPAPSKAATARVLADIDAAVRPVERARTAAAVDQVLASAAPSIFGTGYGGWEVTEALTDELGIDPAVFDHDDDCPCDYAYEPRECATPGLVATSDAPHARRQHQRYAPWNVSPHLFPTDPR